MNHDIRATYDMLTFSPFVRPPCPETALRRLARGWFTARSVTLRIGKTGPPITVAQPGMAAVRMARIERALRTLGVYDSDVAGDGLAALDDLREMIGAGDE
jgi:hypothetical protein